MDVERLKSIPLFAPLSEEALRAISLTVREVSVSEGTHIVDEGEYSYDFYVIDDGTAEVLQDGKMVAELGPGDFFGEMGLMSKERRNATIVAHSPVRLLTLTAWDVRRLRNRMPEVVEQINEAIAERSNAQ